MSEGEGGGEEPMGEKKEETMKEEKEGKMRNEMDCIFTSSSF